MGKSFLNNLDNDSYKSPLEWPMTLVAYVITHDIMGRMQTWLHKAILEAERIFKWEPQPKLEP